MTEMMITPTGNGNPGIVPPWLQKPKSEDEAPLLPLPGPDVPDEPCEESEEL